MNQYRDFENDQRTFPYDEGREFLQRLHDSGRHYVPIVDSAIYVPNPENASDAYPVFEAGNSSNSFLRNMDGSLMIGDVWPGKMTLLPSGENQVSYQQTPAWLQVIRPFRTGSPRVPDRGGLSR